MKKNIKLLALAGALMLAGCQTAPQSTAPAPVAAAVAAPSLAERWDALKAEQKNIRIRDAADALGVSEAELLATQIGKGVIRLNDGSDTAREIMRRVLDLGEITAISRSDNGVIEVTGTPKRFAPRAAEPTGDAERDAEQRLRMRDIVGGYFGPPIDLRFTFDIWQYAFAVVPEGRDPSLQFFNAQGTAMHKVFLRQEENRAIFDKLVEELRNPDQSANLKIAAKPAKAAEKPAKAAEKPDSEIDVKEFQLAWTEITNVHQFARLVREFGVSREQALRLAPAGASERLEASAVRTLLQEAAKRQEPIMAFVGNEGITEIFSGKVKHVEEKGGFFNVLDPDFNLHLLDSKFKSGWIARRAGLSSVEFYDTDGTLVVTFFAYREQGKPQPKSWDELLKTLPRAK